MPGRVLMILARRIASAPKLTRAFLTRSANKGTPRRVQDSFLFQNTRRKDNPVCPTTTPQHRGYRIG